MSYFTFGGWQIDWNLILLGAAVCVLVLLCWNIWRSINK